MEAFLQSNVAETGRALEGETLLEKEKVRARGVVRLLLVSLVAACQQLPIFTERYSQQRP